MNLKETILEILFPSSCFVCKKEGSYLCQDCKSVLEISPVHKKYSGTNISDLYFALSYRNHFIRDLINKFKHEPFVKELGKSLSSLIIEHLNLLDNKPDFTGFVLLPVPLEKRKLKHRGYNQAEELGKHLAESLKIPLLPDVLMKIKEVPDQTGLKNQERKENLNGAFVCDNKVKIKEKKVLLADDFFSTGSTMEECAKALKEAGAKEIIGIAVARE